MSTCTTITNRKSIPMCLIYGFVCLVNLFQNYPIALKDGMAPIYMKVGYSEPARFSSPVDWQIFNCILRRTPFNGAIVLATNQAEHGFWRRVLDDYNCRQVIFEAKNFASLRTGGFSPSTIIQRQVNMANSSSL